MNEPALAWAAVHSSHNLTLPAAGFGVATAFLFGLLGSVHCFGMLGIHFLCLGGATTWIDRTLARPTQVLVSFWRKFAGLARSPGVIVLGGLHGLLPCPLLYVMFSSAVAMQSPLQAGLLLFSFSLGTVPMMWGIGLTTHYLTLSKRVVIQRVFGGLVLLWGTVLVMHGIGRLR